MERIELLYEMTDEIVTYPEDYRCNPLPYANKFLFPKDVDFHTIKKVIDNAPDEIKFRNMCYLFKIKEITYSVYRTMQKAFVSIHQNRKLSKKYVSMEMAYLNEKCFVDYLLRSKDVLREIVLANFKIDDAELERLWNIRYNLVEHSFDISPEQNRNVTEFFSACWYYFKRYSSIPLN